MSKTADPRILQELAERELCRRQLLPYVLRMHPSYDPGWVHKEICAHLEKFLDDVVNKRSPRLMIFMPPRVGKSMLASENFPAWALGRYPWLEIVGTSYGAALAEGFSRYVRRMVRDDEAHRALFPGIELDDDAQNVGRWMVRYTDVDTGRATMGGGYRAVGVGGALTGAGAHCFVAGTMVTTDGGPRAIEEICAAPSASKILSYDHDRGVQEYRDVQAVSVRAGVGIYRLTTAAGRMVESTGDHPYFVPGRGYVRACELTPGDPLLLEVPDRVCAAGGRGTSSSAKRTQGSLLLAGVRGSTPRGEEPSSVCDVRRGDTKEDEQILRGVQAKAARARCSLSVASRSVRDVLYRVSQRVARPADRFCKILLEAVRADRSLGDYDRAWKPKIPTWYDPAPRATTLGKGVQTAASVSGGARRAKMRSLLRYDAAIARASHRRGSNQQLGGESRHAVRDVPPEATPCDGPRPRYDAVGVVERVREEAVVFDLQVEKNHNFFANALLVHNCLIVDDPVKNAEEANSEVARDATWEWYATTARTRLLPGGGVLVIQTKWHDDDLSGRIVELMKSDPQADQFKIVSYPAIAEFDEPYRKAGEALHPSRYDERAYAQIRASVGPIIWNALYQQNPVPSDGEYFKKDDIQYYAEIPPLASLSIYGAWDLAISQRDSADPSCGVIVGYDHDYNVYVLDRYYGRFGAEEIVNRVMESQKKWKPQIHWMEKEKVQMALGPFIEVAMSVEKINDFVIDPIPPGRRDKEARARALQGLVQRRKVYFPRHAEWTASMVGEMLRFPRGKHDDQVDALAYATMNVNTVSVPTDEARDPQPKSWRDNLWRHIRGKNTSAGHMSS